MDFLKKFAESATENKSTETTHDKPAAPSSEENNSLFASAKLVADAATSTFQNEPADKKKYDNAEVAGAAGDLLEAAQTYGKLDKTSGVGSYVEKAENYLHEYEASNSTKVPKPTSEKEEEPAKPTTEEPKQPTEKEEEEPVGEEPKPSVDQKPAGEPATKPTTTAEEEPEKDKDETSESAKLPSGDDSEEKTSGLGDYAKVAEGFLKKDGESAEGEKGEGGGGGGGGGVGQYVKMAEGFLSKTSDSSEGSKPDSEEGSKQAGGDLLKMAGGFLGKN